ncbi:hypothetical protein JXA88_12240 [Candidatus Fermentibacteria bacterium]|nr:hypothetical protein [Candidatus Fermentibacteria bacterium]
MRWMVLTMGLMAACGGRGGSEQGTALSDSVCTALAEWSGWAEGGKALAPVRDECPRLMTEYGSREAAEPPFFSVEAFAVRGDTLFVADQKGAQLVTMDLGGRVLWKSGRAGQGPGEFSGLAQLAVGDTLIAVSNLNNNRVDLFSRAGTWLRSIPIQCPYDLAFLDENTLVVVTHAEPGGMVQVVDLHTDAVRAFGGPWPFLSANIRGNRDLHCAVVGDHLLAVCSYYANHIEVYDCRRDTLVAAFHRTLPAGVPDHSVKKDAGGEMMFFTLQTFLLDIFAGADGAINVLLRPFAPDKTVDCAAEGVAEVGIIDRFSTQGEYLGSYAVPVSASQAVLRGSEIFVSSSQEDMIHRFALPQPRQE